MIRPSASTIFFFVLTNWSSVKVMSDQLDRLGRVDQNFVQMTAPDRDRTDFVGPVQSVRVVQHCQGIPRGLWYFKPLKWGGPRGITWVGGVVHTCLATHHWQQISQPHCT